MEKKLDTEEIINSFKEDIKLKELDDELNEFVDERNELVQIIKDIDLQLKEWRYETDILMNQTKGLTLAADFFIERQVKTRELGEKRRKAIYAKRFKEKRMIKIKKELKRIYFEKIRRKNEIRYNYWESVIKTDTLKTNQQSKTNQPVV